MANDMNWNELKESIPDVGFVENYEIYRRARPTTTLIVLRTVTDPTLFRNSDSERAETQEFSGVLHAQVNGEKFVSKERLTGLNLCRELDDKGDIIDPDYTYNEPLSDLEKSQTADMLTYGLAGTVSGATYSQKSRVIEGYTYSLERYDLMNKEVHNALYESGTMRNETGKQSEALFSPTKVQPGTHFVHFVTLEAGTKEMFLYLLHNILNTSRYGARETRTGRNIRNEIIGCIQSPSDSSLSCGEMILDHISSDTENLPEENIKAIVSSYLMEHKRADWDVFVKEETKKEGTEKKEDEQKDKKDKITFNDFPEWLTKAINVCERKEKASSDVLSEALVILRDEGLRTVEKEKKSEEKKTSRV